MVPELVQAKQAVDGQEFEKHRDGDDVAKRPSRKLRIRDLDPESNRNDHLRQDGNPGVLQRWSPVGARHAREEIDVLYPPPPQAPSEAALPNSAAWRNEPIWKGPRRRGGDPATVPR